MARAIAPAITPEGSLTRYLQEIRKFPMLKPEEEFMLAKAWTEHEDSEAAHKLVTSHLRLVAKIAMGYRGYGLPVGELIAEGNVGMMQAVKRFDPAYAAGIIYGRIGRDPRNRLKMKVVPEESKKGRDAVTHYKVIRRLEPKRQTFGRGEALKRLAPSLSLVECRLETGRTHQVRVHMSHIRHPLVGDPFYGKSGPILSKNFSDQAQEAISTFKRQALHAYVIGFIHPTTGETLTFEAELPNDMKRLISALEQK